jgi:hypothetical protein
MAEYFKNKGGINNIYDFRKRAIKNCNTGILIEDGKPNALLRFASNLTVIKNVWIGGGTLNGIVIRTGANILPRGSGGNIKIENCTFESISAIGTSIYIEENGEVVGLDTVEIDHCWFEAYGLKVITLKNAKARLQNCFIAGATTGIIELLESSNISLNETNGYFLDSSSPTGLISGDFTTSQYRITNCNFKGQLGLTAAYPKLPIESLSQSTLKINYNAVYPVGNNDYNYNLSLDIFAETNKLFGETWKHATIIFCGNDGTQTIGCLTVQLFKNGAVTLLVDITKVGVGAYYTITGNSITFLNDGSGRWYNMEAYFTAMQY